MALFDAEQKLKEHKDSKGMFSGMMDFFGAGDEAEVKGVENLIARKRIEADEFAKTGKLSPTDRANVAAQKQTEQWAAQKEADANAIGKSTGDAIASKTLKVHITNAKDLTIGGGDAAPRVDDKGRRGPGAK
jgi:hypothetical protein